MTSRRLSSSGWPLVAGWSIVAALIAAARLLGWSAPAAQAIQGLWSLVGAGVLMLLLASGRWRPALTLFAVGAALAVATLGPSFGG